MCILLYCIYSAMSKTRNNCQIVLKNRGKHPVWLPVLSSLLSGTVSKFPCWKKFGTNLKCIILGWSPFPTDSSSIKEEIWIEVLSETEISSKGLLNFYDKIGENWWTDAYDKFEEEKNLFCEIYILLYRNVCNF